MTCPKTDCQSKAERALTAVEASEVGEIPQTDHDVTWEPFQLCTECGTVFTEGKMDVLPIILIAGCFTDMDEVPVWQRS